MRARVQTRIENQVLRNRIINAMENPVEDKRQLHTCHKTQKIVSKMKESQMIVEGYDKKSYGIIPKYFKEIDIEFSYSQCTYNDIAE